MRDSESFHETNAVKYVILIVSVLTLMLLPACMQLKMEEKANGLSFSSTSRSPDSGRVDAPILEDPSTAILEMPNLAQIYGCAWGRDGRSIFFIGTKELDDLTSGRVYAYHTGDKKVEDLQIETVPEKRGWLAAERQEIFGCEYESEEPSRIFKMNLETGEREVIFQPEPEWTLADYAVSPNGDVVAVSVNDNGGTESYVLLLLRDEKFKPQHIWGGKGFYAQEFYWAPNSESLAWRGGHAGDSAFYVMLDKINIVRVNLPLDERHKFGCWSPDGEEIVYGHLNTKVAQSELYVWIWNARTQESRVLIRQVEHDKPIYLTGARWSPDGEWIACAIDKVGEAGAGVDEVRLISADGKKQVSLGSCRTFRGGNFFERVWQNSEPNGKKGVSKSQKFSSLLGAWSGLSWTPDGNGLIFARGNTIRLLRLPDEVSASLVESVPR